MQKMFKEFWILKSGKMFTGLKISVSFLDSFLDIGLIYPYGGSRPPFSFNPNIFAVNLL